MFVFTKGPEINLFRFFAQRTIPGAFIHSKMYLIMKLVMVDAP